MKSRLHPVKVGVLCAVSVRRIVGPLSFNETINCEGYIQAILGQSFPELTEEETPYCWFQQDSATSHNARISMQARLCPMSSATELSAVVFGQHVHLILILVFFSSGVV
jgi:hypothetical protein